MASDSSLDDPITGPLWLLIAEAIFTIAAVLTLGFWLAGRYNTDDGGTISVVGGVAVLVETVARRPWFWDNPKVLLVRAIVGDRGATVFYALIGIGLGLFGTNRLVYWHSAVVGCARSYAEATSTHDKVSVLVRIPPMPTVPRFLAVLGQPQLLTCGRYRERGGF